MDYKQSRLWRNSLGNESYNETELRNRLCNEYESSRGNAIFLLDKIQNDFPNLTIHDISHIDNLWHIASIITGNEYEINPLEGFVMGCAFLVHDAVLSYDVIGGVEALRNTCEWKDFYADYDSNMESEEIIKECDFRTIRLLHAERAEAIFSQIFQREDGTSFYIINDLSLREHLGELIGKIAASHHWDIEEVERLGNQFGAPAGFPIGWNINPIKIACILRCADAGHIDGNRAPDLIMHSRCIDGTSKNHWTAQNYLSQIMIDTDDASKLVIQSNKSFEEKDFEAWNVAYDMVKLLDNELRKSNGLLQKCGISQFQAKSVRGVESQEEFSSYIKTKGWKPCDAEIHIGDVEHLIKTIGGEKLYGKDNKFEIVLRELIQNARDAIVARQKREDGIEGKIRIRISKDENGIIWVEVIDNGIGMSLRTVKECLLNFGKSFWKSDSMKTEFPGLNATGFKSIGEFGIGFYSIFMVAKDILIETRRFDKGLDTAIQLKFNNGFCLRPIVKKVTSESTEYSTRVFFSLDEDLEKWEATKLIKPNVSREEPFEVPYFAVVANLAAGLDVDVYYSDMSTAYRMVHKNIHLLEEKTPEIAEWLRTISYADYRKTDIYKDYIDNNYMRLEKVFIDGRFKGILALNTLWQMRASYLGVETVGGLTTFNKPFDVGGYIGCLISEPETARRNTVYNIFEMHDWAQNQLRMILESKLSITDCVYLPYAISPYRIDVSSIVEIVCYRKGKDAPENVRMEKLIQSLADTEERIVFVVSTMFDTPRVDNHISIERYYGCAKEGEWVFIPVENSSFLSLEENNMHGYSILDYIGFIAKRHGISIKKETEEKRVQNQFGYLCAALKIGFTTK